MMSLCIRGFPELAAAFLLSLGFSLVLSACNGGGGGEGDGLDTADLPYDGLDTLDSFDFADGPDGADAPDIMDAPDADAPHDPATDEPGEEEMIDPDAVITTLWHPYGEWSFENASWDGNPFDVQARATFSDGPAPYLFYDGGSTWKLRYMCTQIGTFTFATASADPELDGLEGTVVCRDNPGAMGLLTAGGTDNKKFYVRGWEKAIAPAWVMMPDITPNSTGAPDDPAVINEWIANNIDGTGFRGAHNMGCANIWYDWDCDGTRAGCASEDPDPRTFRAFEELMETLYGHGAFIHIWMFWDCQRDKCDKYHDDAARRERLRHYLADRWGAIPHWMIGEGFDNFEDDDAAYANKWFYDIFERLAWPHLLGMRSLHDSYELICTDCSYFSWENVEMNYTRWSDSYDAAADRPSFEEDRYRVRDEGRPKDIPPGRLDMLLRNHLWPQVMVGGVGAVYGYLLDSGGSYSLVGGYPASPLDWNSAVKAWHDFWFASDADPVHRFMPDMERCNSLTSGRGLCAAGKYYVFYDEETDDISFDVSALAGDVPAMAMDTWTGEIVDLGMKGPGYVLFNAPHESDWAVAIGNFE